MHFTTAEFFVSLQVWLFVVAALTLTTITCFIINTFDDYRVDRENIPTLPNNATYNFFYSNPKRKTLLVKVVPLERLILEGVCNGLLLVDRSVINVSSNKLPKDSPSV